METSARQMIGEDEPYPPSVRLIGESTKRSTPKAHHDVFSRREFDQVVNNLARGDKQIRNWLETIGSWDKWPPDLQAILFRRTGYRPTTMFVKTGGGEQAK